jgi:hypothetical protein
MRLRWTTTAADDLAHIVEYARHDALALAGWAGVNGPE